MALAKLLLVTGKDYYFSAYSFPNIAETRNMFATLWYDKTDADWMLSVDADMQFDPAMILAMIKFNKPVVGCLYPKKTFPIQYVGSWKPGAKIENGFMEVDAVGFGVTLMHRSVITDLLESGQAVSDERPHSGLNMPQYGMSRLIRAFDQIDTDRGRLSEDISLCHRYKACGGEIWADISHTIKHVGAWEFTGRFADVLEAQESAA